MVQNDELFKKSALQQISKIIAEKFTGSQIFDFFNRIGISNIVSTESTKWKFTYETLDQLQNTKGRDEIVRMIEQFCDGQEFFGENNTRFYIIQKINEVLIFYNMKYDTKTSHIVLIRSLKKKMQRPLPEGPASRLEVLYGVKLTLYLLKNKEIDLTYESAKQKFPKLSKKIFEHNMNFLLKYSLTEKRNNSYVITKKANEIFFSDVDQATRILRLLTLDLFDLNEIASILNIKFDNVGAIFIALADRGLVTSTTSRPYGGTAIGGGTPIVQLTPAGIKFIKEMNNNVSTAANILEGEDLQEKKELRLKIFVARTISNLPANSELVR